MMRMLNSLLRAFWWTLSPIHRPFMHKFDAHVNRLVNEAMAAELEARLVPTLTAALEATSLTVERLDSLIARTDRSAQETDQALGGILGEVTRLRQHVELLQQLIQPGDGQSSAEDDYVIDGLAFEGTGAACEPFPSDPAEEGAPIG